MAEPVFIDADSGFHSDKEDNFSFKQILMAHFKKVAEFASKEFRGGYWVTKSKLMPNGVTSKEKEYVPDSREEYCNSISALFDMLLPHLLQHKQLRSKESIKFYEDCLGIEANLEDLREKFLETTEKEDKEILSIESYSGSDKELLEQYKFTKLRVYRKLYQKLSCFLFEKGYFAGESIEE